MIRPILELSSIICKSSQRCTWRSKSLCSNIIFPLQCSIFLNCSENFCIHSFLSLRYCNNYSIERMFAQPVNLGLLYYFCYAIILLCLSEELPPPYSKYFSNFSSRICGAKSEYISYLRARALASSVLTYSRSVSPVTSTPRFKKCNNPLVCNPLEFNCTPRSPEISVNLLCIKRNRLSKSCSLLGLSLALRAFVRCLKNPCEITLAILVV